MHIYTPAEGQLPEKPTLHTHHFGPLGPVAFAYAGFLTCPSRWLHAGIINDTGSCRGAGGCAKGDLCVYDYDTYQVDACCERFSSDRSAVYHD